MRSPAWEISSASARAATSPDARRSSRTAAARQQHPPTTTVNTITPVVNRDSSEKSSGTNTTTNAATSRRNSPAIRARLTGQAPTEKAFSMTRTVICLVPIPSIATTSNRHRPSVRPVQAR
jgi:hypothetical protein